jgi:predicted MFS family arabinose efflux permease
MIRLFHSYRNAFSNIQSNIWVLALTMLINRSGSMVLLFTSLYLTKDLHLTIANAGFVLSFYGIGSVLGSYVGGWLADRKNFFDIMLFSLISSGAILLFLLIASTPFYIAFIIFLYAFSADMFRPANSKAVAAYSIPENRTRSVSLVRMAINLGFSIGPAVGGFVALYLGYKWLFVIDAFTSFAAAIILFIFLPRKTNTTTNIHTSILNDSSTSAYRDMPYLYFIILVAMYGVGFFQLFASVPQYFNKVCHYDEDTIGLLIGLNGVLVVLIEMPFIAYLEKKQKIFPYIIAGSLCIGIAYSILVLGKGAIAFALIYTLVITFAEMFAMPFMYNHALSRPGVERQGQYSALYSISYGLANIAAPVLGLGIASRFGFDNMFYFFVVLSLLTTLGFMLLHQWNTKKKNSLI